MYALLIYIHAHVKSNAAIKKSNAAIKKSNAAIKKKIIISTNRQTGLRKSASEN